MKKTILFLLSFLLFSCVTKKTIEEPKEIVTKKNELSLWGAKAQIKEYKTEKVQQVTLDFVAQAAGAVRVDVSGPLGVSLASLVVKNKKIQYVLYRQKSFYEGVANEKALRSVFRMDLDARYLMNICYDLPIQEKGWECQMDQGGRVERCQNLGLGLSVLWSDRDGYKKRVTLSNAEYEVQILYKDYSTKVLDESQEQKGPFQLETPEGFQKYKIL